MSAPTASVTGWSHGRAARDAIGGIGRISGRATTRECQMTRLGRGVIACAQDRRDGRTPRSSGIPLDARDVVVGKDVIRLQAKAIKRKHTDPAGAYEGLRSMALSAVGCDRGAGRGPHGPATFRHLARSAFRGRLAKYVQQAWQVVPNGGAVPMRLHRPNRCPLNVESARRAHDSDRVAEIGVSIDAGIRCGCTLCQCGVGRSVSY